MSKKAFIIILVLSVVVTYGMAIVGALMNPSASKAGLPLKFGSYTLFGTADTNYVALVLDIVFWFIIILLLWKVLQKVVNR